MPDGSCAFCGTDTGLARQPEPELGTLSMDEFETLVRGEWRRRLGAGAYDRPHSAGLVRALLVYGLEPRSPVRSLVVVWLLYRELTRYGMTGACQREIRRELRILLEAIERVLRANGRTATQTEAFVASLVDLFRNVLGWLIMPPDPEAGGWAAGEETGPGRRAGAAS